MILTSMGDDINIDDIIFISKQTLYKHYMLMGIILIIVIGVIVEYGIFANIEKLTVRKWGMVR